MNELRRMDLNLLLALHALLTERHVTRAAARLHKSQPATSHALSQLRDYFNDPLLVREGGKMVLTPKAQQLLQPLENALFQLNDLLDKPDFCPESANRLFRLAMSDYATHILLPPLIRKLRHHAPNIRLCVVQASRESMTALLQEGQIDFGFSPQKDGLPEEIQSIRLFQDHFVGVTDRANLPEGGWTLDAWYARPHILLGLDQRQDDIAKALEAQKLPLPECVLTLPHWGVALKLLPQTDLILTTAAKSMQNLTQYPTLSCFAPPVALPAIDYHLIWHKRQNHDPAHQWLRQNIGELI